ncbi:MAG: PDZ domain-containing protein [Planctomycetota bacterium]|nr:MAG: PDZ domain-containing protein [Planctomycetota bacterium]
MGACVTVAMIQSVGLLAAWPGQRFVAWVAAHPVQTLQAIFGLGFVIFVHELGHFLVAKACGVKCEKFFLGFDVGGWKLCSFKWGETEYGIGALPLGGYVKMLGQDDNPGAATAESHRARASGDLPAEPTSDPHPAWDPRSYPAQSVPKRMAIISAGVIMNVLFAVLMASWAFGLGVRELTCAVSGVRPGGAAWRAGIRTGDEITAIGNRQDPIFSDLQKGVALGDLSKGVDFTIHRPSDDSTRTVTLQPDTDLGAPTVGITSPYSLTVPDGLAGELPGAAGRAQPPLAAGDTILSVDGQPISRYDQLAAVLASDPARPVVLGVERKGARDGERIDVVLPGQPRRSLGMVMTGLAVKAVQEGSPAAIAGLKVGDRLQSLDGEPLGDPLTLDLRLRGRTGQPVRLGVERAGVDEELTVTPREVTWIEETRMRATPVSVASLGIAIPVEATVVAVDADGPAARAGIAPGERIKKVWVFEKDAAGDDQAPEDPGMEIGAEVSDWPSVVASLQTAPSGTRVRLRVGSPTGEERTVDLEPADVSGEFAVDRGLIFEPVYRIVRAASFAGAMKRGASKVKDDLSMVYGFLHKLTSNQISPRLLGGPIEIAKQAGRSAEEGFSRLLLFLTMLSANLAVVNFLPIPVLDGGHMVFLVYEWIRGKPPSESVVIALSYLGLILILSLMMFVFGLDLGLFSRFVPGR